MKYLEVILNSMLNFTAHFNHIGVKVGRVTKEGVK